MFDTVSFVCFYAAGMALLMEDVNSSHSGTYSCDVQNIAGGFVWLEASVLVVE